MCKVICSCYEDALNYVLYINHTNLKDSLNSQKTRARRFKFCSLYFLHTNLKDSLKSKTTCAQDDFNLVLYIPEAELILLVDIQIYHKYNNLTCEYLLTQEN